MIKLGYLKLKNPFELDDQNLKSLSHINLSFAKVVDQKGTVEFDPYDEQKLVALRTQNPNIKISLAIGGWGAGNFSEAASTLDNRENFTKTTLAIVEKYNLDGVDLDWEYPCFSDSGISSSPDDKVNFTKLMSEIRNGLNNLETENEKKYILTFAAGANEKLVDCVELEKLNEITDFMNLMTYDMGGSFGIAGHHASLYPSELTEKKGGAHFVDLYVQAGYPIQKIVYGAAFYGRGGTGVDRIGSQITGEEGLYFDYHDIKKMEQDEAVSCFYDDIAKGAYCMCDGTFITYDNADSIKAKLEYVKEHKLAGIMFWEHATDNTGELLEIIINYSE
ncbi:MAG: glycoside hydrolase family 18 protein [Bacilli bacterium]